MWLATLMGSDIIKEADDKKLIKKFICNKGLINVMKGDKKDDPEGSKAEVVRICGTDDSGDDSGTTALTPDTTVSGNAGGKDQETSTTTS